MPEISGVAGRVVEAARFVNANKKGAPRWGFPERRELWLQAPRGKERKFVLHTRTLPARRGHDVMLLVRQKIVVGMVNLTTGDAVNYAREDPVGLLHFKDFMVALAVAVGAMCVKGTHGLAAGAAAWAILWLGRWLLRTRLQRRIDACLESVYLRFGAKGQP